MATKVLVFESDSAFAGELQRELGKLGCATTVVDDGNVGLQHAGSDRPDLILLSIELPRMNGFSVCNKLKKDAKLKDVPLIIMSSESSEETFEQHKKLRTRAEDYVHKPIAFGELLQHIQGFVALDAAALTDDGAIVIDDEIEVGTSDYLLEEDLAPASLAPTSGPPTSQAPTSEKQVDADIDAFAESAFGRLTEPEGSIAPMDPRAVTSNGTTAAVDSRPPPPRSSVPPPRAIGPTARPPTPGVDLGELGRARQELANSREKLAATERKLEAAEREAEDLRLEAGDAERLGREVEELKTRLTSGAKTGAVSSRDFLDLREALNKKDKEILGLREQLSKKDKEIVETQDKMLGFERSKADIDDRLIVLERELEETKEKSEALAADKDLAKKASEDFRTRLEKAKADVEAKDKLVVELRGKLTNDLAAAHARADAERAEVDQARATERSEHMRLLQQAEDRHKADGEQARRDLTAALEEAREKSEGEKSEALHAQEEQLREAHEAEVSARQREHEQTLARVREELASLGAASDLRRQEEVAVARKEGEEKVEAARAEARRNEAAALQALRSDFETQTSALENDRDARIANVETKAAHELAAVNETLAKLGAEAAATRRELDSLRDQKRAEDEAWQSKVRALEQELADSESARATIDVELAEKIQRLAGETARADKAQAKWESDKQSLERAKDAMAVALAQMEEMG